MKRKRSNEDSPRDVTVTNSSGDSLITVTYHNVSARKKKQLEKLLWEWAASSHEEVDDKQKTEELCEVEFYQGFCIDRSGQKSILKESIQDIPVILEVPKYDKTCAIVGEENNASEVKLAPQPPQPRCFNCGKTEHSFQECPEPRNSEVISANRRKFLQSQTPKPSPQFNRRYYIEDKYGSLRPGVISPELRRALTDMKDGELPPFYERMKRYGLPPSYAAMMTGTDNLPSGIEVYDHEDSIPKPSSPSKSDGIANGGTTYGNETPPTYHSHTSPFSSPRGPTYTPPISPYQQNIRWHLQQMQSPQGYWYNQLHNQWNYATLPMASQYNQQPQADQRNYSQSPVVRQLTFVTPSYSQSGSDIRDVDMEIEDGQIQE